MPRRTTRSGTSSPSGQRPYEGPGRHPATAPCLGHPPEAAFVAFRDQGEQTLAATPQGPYASLVNTP